MKKIGLGTRPSAIKEKDKTIEIDQGLSSNSSYKVTPPRQAPKRHKAPSSKYYLKIALIVATAFLIGAFFKNFEGIKNVFSTEISLDHLTFTTGNKTISLKDKKSFTVNYREGLILKNTVLNGIYRLFPPDNVATEILGIPESRNLFHKDLISLLKPEDSTTYEIAVSHGDKQIGKVSLTLNMDAADWIARADTVQNKKKQTLCFKKAIAIDPSSEIAHTGLARIYEEKGQIKKAIAEYEKAVKINPKNTTALQSLIPLYKKTKRKTNLIVTYRLLAEAMPDRADHYYYQAGLIAEKKGDDNGALALYRKSLSSNSSHINARKRLIKIYEKTNQWSRVAANTEVLLRVDPNNANLHLYLSEAYLKTGKTKKAIAHAQKAAKLWPRNSSVHLQLALLYERAKKEKKAIEHYKRAIKLNKKNAAAYNNLGLLLEKNGNRKDAIRNYHKAVSLAPNNIIFHINLADAYEKEKQLKKAISEYKKVVKLNKKQFDAWEALAVLYQRVGQEKAALKAYMVLAEKEPKRILWHRQMAALYENLGNLDKAKKEYEIILTLNPKDKQASQSLVDISIKKIQRKLKH